MSSDNYGKNDAPYSNIKVIEQFYPPSVAKEVLKEIEHLMKPYAGEIKCGVSHPAPSSTWRSERILHRHDRERSGRFAYRIHLFESRAVEQGGQVIYPGSSKTRGGATGRYLGFVSLRPDSFDHGHEKENGKELFYFKYTATATLTPPPFTQRPRYHVITCVMGVAEGELPFRATPFCQPESFPPGSTEKSNNFPCLHAALDAALLLKRSTYENYTMSNQDMVALLWKQIRQTESMKALNSSGCSLDDALTILRSSAIGAGGVVEKFTCAPTKTSNLVTPPPFFENEKVRQAAEKKTKQLKEARQTAEKEAKQLEVLQCLSQYLANGVPVILDVLPKEETLETGHAVLVVGMRLMADPDEKRGPIPSVDGLEFENNELPSRLIVHDSKGGPYYEISSAHVLDSAWIDTNAPRQAPTPADRKRESGIRFLAVLPKHTTIGITDVRNMASHHTLRHGVDFWREYAKAYFKGRRGRNIDDTPRLRYVIRMLRPHEIASKYFADGEEGKMRSVLNTFFRLNAAIRPSHWWCAEVRFAEQYQPLDGVEMVPPALVYMIPLSISRDALNQHPTVKIEFHKPSRWTLTTYYRKDAKSVPLSDHVAFQRS